MDEQELNDETPVKCCKCGWTGDANELEEFEGDDHGDEGVEIVLCCPDCGEEY